MPSEYFSDRSRSTLAVACAASDTTLTITTPAQEFPAQYPYRLICGTEIARVTARAGNVLTVTRGIEGTTAAAHAAGAVVAHGVTAGALNDLAARANLIGDQYGKPLDNAPATRGRMYYDEFTPSLYVDDGAVWEEVRPNPRTHTHNQSQIVGLLTALAAKEAALGNPTIDGQVLASTTAGVRSWITASTVSPGGATPYTKHTEILVTGLAPTDAITAADLGPDPVYAGHDFIYAEVQN